MTSPTYPTRPVVALRIGITGARCIAADHAEHLSSQLRDVLRTAQERMRELAADPSVGVVYHHESGTVPQPLLRFISPLALGADRLAAREALALKYQLHVPMPFPQAEYEKDFGATDDDLTDFRALLARAEQGVLALDGDHSAEADRAYEAVGRYVVRHCDLLIAIWDRGARKGSGGTADIMRYAAIAGVPIWWLNATEECPPVWIADIQDLRHPKAEPVEAKAALLDYLNRLIPPPPPCDRPRHGIVRLARLFQKHHVSPEADHFAERANKRPWPWFCHAYKNFMKMASGLNLPDRPSEQSEDPIVAPYWFDRYRPSDERARDYAACYRSTYVWVFGFGTLAVLLGALALITSLLALGHPGALEDLTLGLAGMELTMLLLILAFVLVAIRQDWHERSIEYRLLAELYRKQQALAPLGWALPATAVRRAAASDDPAEHRSAWVSWLFEAEQRAAPLPHGSLTERVRDVPRKRVLEQLIAEQRTYHQDRGARNTKAGHRLERWGGFLFGAVILFVVAKLALTDLWQLPEWAVPFAFLATVLPAISAAFVGIRAYAEMQLLAEQSRHMIAELDRAGLRLARLDSVEPRPLTSQDLGAEAGEVTALMLRDLGGWAQLFRVKGIETV